MREFPLIAQVVMEQYRRGDHDSRRRDGQSVEVPAVDHTDLHVESGEPQGPAGHIHGRGEPPPFPESGERPAISQDGRCHAEGHHVRQRVVFHAELGCGVGHAGDPPVEPVEDQGDRDGDGCVNEVALNGGDDRVDPREEACRREEIRQDVDPLLHLILAKKLLPPQEPLSFVLFVHHRYPMGVSPARTFWPA